MRKVVLSLYMIIGVAACASPAWAQGGLDQRVSELSQQISNGLTENQKRTIAVVEFVDLKGNVTDFGRFLAEELITRLYQTKKFKVIERQLLNKVVTEQKLSLTGMIDQTSAQKLGKLLGVDAIATGTVTDLGKTLRVNARLIDTSTGEIFAVAASEIAKDEAVLKLIGNEASAESKSLPAADANKGIQKVDSQFFSFELQRCRRSGPTVQCYLKITNTGEDRMLEIFVNHTKSFDDYGNEHAGTNVQLANKQENYLAVSNFMVSGTPTYARVTFDGVPPYAKKIKLLAIEANVGEMNNLVIIRFRDILLTD